MLLMFNQLFLTSGMGDTMFRKLGLVIVAVIVVGMLVPAGQAQAQCGCGAPCGDALMSLVSCVLSGNTQNCASSVESSFVSCLGCLQNCNSSCYTGCLTNFTLNHECQQEDEACIVGLFSPVVSCLRACDICDCGFTDGRLDQISCAQPVATYCTADGIEVWDIDAEGYGTLLFTAPADGEVPASNQTLMQVGDVLLSRLSTGEFQLNALDEQGNPYVLVWDGCPANEVYLIK